MRLNFYVYTLEPYQTSNFAGTADHFQTIQHIIINENIDNKYHIRGAIYCM